MTDSETPCSRSSTGNALAINPEGNPCAKYRADNIANRRQPSVTTHGVRSISRLSAFIRSRRLSVPRILSDGMPGIPESADRAMRVVNSRALAYRVLRLLGGTWQGEV